MTTFIPAQGEFGSDIPAGDGKFANLRFTVYTVLIYLVVPVDAEHVDDDKGDEDKEGGEDGLQVSVVLVAQQGCRCPAHRNSALSFKFRLTDCG